MELNHHNPFLILDSHHGIGQSLGCKSLSHTGRTLQNHIFLDAN